MKKCIPVLILLLVSSLYPQVNIDIDKLLERGGLLYAPNKEKPFTGSVFDLFDNGQYKLKGRYRSGLKHGKWTWWNYNGEKRKEVIWQNGKEISTKEWEYFKNGLKSKERKYKDGEKDGKWLKWYANGQKESEENYKVGVIDDEWIEWYENGQKKIEKKYKNGEPNGDWTEWNIDGQKEVEAFFKGGNRDRSWTWWYENGQIRQEVTYKDDEIIGVWTSWDEKGIIVWEGTIEEYEAEEDCENADETWSWNYDGIDNTYCTVFEFSNEDSKKQLRARAVPIRFNNTSCCQNRCCAKRKI